jgi:UDP-N-acetylglucosamine 2-epimerase (non-hydrolysing)
MLFTGQHPDLEPANHGLDAYPSLGLGCPGEIDPHSHVGNVSKALLPLLLEVRPALLIVQGDTSSALGGALAAKIAGIPIAHVEAGLRSHDRRHPWPEEEFRIAIDADAELLFAPTELSAANLRREGVRGAIHVTGNSGVDAVLAARSDLEPPPRPARPRLLVTCHRRENWNLGISSVASALAEIAAANLARVEIVLHPNAAVAGQMRQPLLGTPGIAFREPCGHLDTIAAILACDLLLTDSGGLQEEAASLGVPALVLRMKTERPEAIASGHLELVGTDPRRIVSAVRRRLQSGQRLPPVAVFGDGKASQRIAAVIADWLGQRCSSGHDIEDAPIDRIALAGFHRS